MADDEGKTSHDHTTDGGGGDGKPSGGAEQAIRRPDLRPRTLSHAEREQLRARLQKKFH